MSNRWQFGRFGRQVRPSQDAPRSPSKPATTILKARAFDAEFYRAQLPTDIGDSDMAAIAHYSKRGYKRNVSPHPLIETEYLDQSEDADEGALLRRLRRRRDLLDPHPLIDLNKWADWYPDSREHRFGPLGHLLAKVQPETVLPVHAQWDIDGVTYREFRDHMLGVVTRLARQRRSAVNRITSDFNAAEHVDEIGTLRTIADSLAAPPEVTIVMPVYNRQDSVATAIESVQRQTWRHWKLIVVDDGSTDRSVAIVSALAAKDSRIEVVRSQHVGVSAARNQGLDKATADLVAFLDSDNEWRPDFLRTMVGALADRSRDGAYAVLQFVDEGQPRFRAFEGDFEAMFEGPFLDLNVLVCRREALLRVGRFDTSLARMVDYDLILGLFEAGNFDLIPIVGVDYDNHQRPDRISVRESVLWGDVIRRRHLRLTAARAPKASASAAGISVVIAASDSFDLTARAITEALASDEDGGQLPTEVCVICSGVPMTTTRMLQACFGLRTGVRIMTWHGKLATSLVIEAGLRATNADKLLFQGPATSVGATVRRALAEALDSQTAGDLRVGVVAPLVLARNGQMVDAGMSWLGSEPLPYPTLAGHPVEDFSMDARRTDVPAVSNSTFMVRRMDLLEFGGIDPLMGESLGIVDLCLRFRESGRTTVLLTDSFAQTDIETSHHEGRLGLRQQANEVRRQANEAARELAGAAEFRKRWSGRHPQPSADAWTRAGLEVLAISPVSMDLERTPLTPEMHRGRRGAPVAIRPAREVSAGPAVGMESLRWSIKIGARPGEIGNTWEDLPFAAELARSLRELGQDVVIDRRNAFVKQTDYLDDVSLLLRGPTQAPANPGRCQVLWVISHADSVTVDEVQGQDLVFATNTNWANNMSHASGQRVEPLVNATDPTEPLAASRARPSHDDQLSSVERMAVKTEMTEANDNAWRLLEAVLQWRTEHPFPASS